MSATRHLLDPDLLAGIEASAPAPTDDASLQRVRAEIEVMLDAMRGTRVPDASLRVFERLVPGRDGAPAVRVLIYQPGEVSTPLPALLWIHGGGFVAGTADWGDFPLEAVAKTLPAVIVSVDYRLAPETAFPGAIEDCYTALAWLHGQAQSLGVDPARIAIAGVSAGGGLAASLGLLARDCAQVPVAFQALLQPMLDDRTCLPGWVEPGAGEFIWRHENNVYGWTALLGHAPGGEGVSPYAAAARAGSLAGLPPTFISVGALDLFLDENVAYAARLLRAGVPTEMHVYPGACHGFQLLARQSALALAHDRDVLEALRRALHPAAKPAQEVTSTGSAGDPEVEAIAQQLSQLLPGIPAEDLPRFARSIRGGEPYAPGSDSVRAEGVRRGAISTGVCPAGSVYPGVDHEYWLYVPARLEFRRDVGLMVFQDGARYLGPEIDVPAVLDNLIHVGQLPPLVAVFVQPGAHGPGLPIYGGNDNRSIEYDCIDGDYARFLIDELLPMATRGLRISADPAQRAICGISSGGVCAFNVAWQRPDAFGKVISHCGSFVDIRGGHKLAAEVRRAPRKALRVFLQTGSNDLDILFGSWTLANQAMASALDYRGYDHQLVIGEGGHSLAHGGAIFPDTLRWLWRDGLDSKSPNKDPHERYSD